MRFLLGIDIGGTKCAVVQASLHGTALEIHGKISFPTPPNSPGLAIEKITKACMDLLQGHECSLEDVEAIGISCGGPLDSQKGTILSPPNLMGWNDVPIADLLEKNLGRRPTLQNDANACAVAEWKFGAGRGLQNMIFLTFGTGLGAGLILNGQLYSGSNDMAGEVGHIRLETTGPVGYGKAGSFEGFCSGSGIPQIAATLARERFQMGQKVSFCSSQDQIQHLDARTIAEFAEAGDELAQQVYRISGHYLGQGLAILIDILNPQAIVIGSIFTRRMNLLWKAASEVIDREALPLARKVCQILPAELGEQLGDYAALAVATYGLERETG